LFESENKNGFIHGYTDNYIRVKTIWSSDLVDSIVKRKLSVMSDDNLVVV
jgi:threonylcarbamoyladenosine tRNA methylthiotransferase MtaB